MLKRSPFLSRRLVFPSRGGGGGGSRALSYTFSSSSHQSHRAPSSASPPPSYTLRTSPSPSATRLSGRVSTRWPPPSAPPPRPYNPMTPYLVRACGFSFDEAVAAAELLSGNKSSRNPNSPSALSGKRSPLETQIGWLVSPAPPLSGKDGAVDDVGFSGRTLALLMLLDPGALTGADASRKIGFWCALFRAEADLVQALGSTTRSPGSSRKEAVVQKMILLRGCGAPIRELRAALRKDSEDVARSVDSLEALIKRVEELGLARGRQDAYQYALRAIGALSKRKLEAKLGGICANVGRGEQKTPQAVGDALGIFSSGSPGSAGKAMEGRMEVSGACDHSIPLTLGLEKKVMPPYYVLQVLKSKDCSGESGASYLLRMCKKARFWTNSCASMNREFQSSMRLISLLVQGRIAI